MELQYSSRRRQFIKAGAIGGAISIGSGFLENFTGGPRRLKASPQTSGRQFTMDLCPGRIGASLNQLELIELGAKYGFESVEPFGAFLRSQSAQERKQTNEKLHQAGLVWGAAGLPVQFRESEAEFEKGLKDLPAIAAALESVGVRRMGTWLMPNHVERTYLQNFELHVLRLSKIAAILDNYGMTLGLEYVGPRTLWADKRYAFIHTMAETKELIEAIEPKNVGFVLDSWHWYTAEETLNDLRSLTANQIVAVDLNDAPAGIPVEEQIDNRRELPTKSGVIDLKAFLNALIAVDYAGPVRAEPFNQALNELDDEAAVRETSEAMKAAFSLIG